MSENDPSAVIRTRDRIFNLFNIRTKVDKEEKESMLKKIKEPGSFSSTEVNLLKNINKNNDGGYRKTTSMDAIKQDLFNVSHDVAKQIDENKSFQAMVPEINKAKSIMVPSIMAPSDMYGNDFTVILNCPKLDITITDAISTLLSDYINDKLSLGSDVTRWIGDALFDTGSTPVMVVPRKMVTVLAGTDEEEATPSTEDEIEISTSNCTVGVEDLMFGNNNIEFTYVEPSEEEVLSVLTPLSSKDTLTISEEQLDKVTQETKSVLDNSVTISLDYRKIKSLDEKIKKANEESEKQLTGMISKIGDTRILNVGNVGLPSEDDEPLIQALPPESVIPIHVPGTPSAHIGYFVLLDENGNPIDKPDLKFEEGNCNGNPLVTSIDDIINKASSKQKNRLEALSTVFELSLKKSLKQTVTGLGIDSGILPDNSKIYSCIFHRAMHKRKVNLIYVPPSLMTYYAFDYREDGTGKALLEDASFLIRMRTSFLVAKTIAALDNATDKHTISFSMEGQKGSNLEQIMGMIKDAYVSKNMYSMDHNPMTVMRDIVSRSISIIPKDMQGVHDLQLEKDMSQGQKSQPDEELPEMLTEFIVLATGVPAAALNALGEDEYSRSVATSNILFSNTIRGYQNHTCDFTGVLIKAYAKNSHYLLTAIIDILKNSELKVATDDMNNYLAYIINNIEVTLPAPNIAPDMSRYEELEKVVSAIENTMEKLLPDDMLVSEQEGAKDMLAAIRADMMRKQVRNAINNIGATGLMDMESLTNIDFRDLRNYNVEFSNYATAIKTMDKVTAPEAGDDDGSGSSW